MKYLELTKNEQKILNFLCDNSGEDFFSAQISKKLRISGGGTHVALKELRGKRLIKKQREGRMLFYKANLDKQFLKQYRITNLLYNLDKLIRELREVSVEIILFGSGARGEYDRESDIDLMIVARDEDLVFETIKSVGLSKRFKLSPIVKTPTAWHEMENKDPEFYNEVLAGIKLSRT